MKMKMLVTGGLLAFVGASVVVLVMKESDRSAQLAALAAPAVAEAASPEAAAPVPEAEDAMVVYYLHTTYRCASCRKLEAYTAEAVMGGFAEALNSKQLIFRSVNLEEPANAHLVKRYSLFSKAVIVSEVRAGEEVRWKNLERIWDLLGDKDAYLTYLRGEIEAFRSAT